LNASGDPIAVFSPAEVSRSESLLWSVAPALAVATPSLWTGSAWSGLRDDDQSQRQLALNQFSLAASLPSSGVLWFAFALPYRVVCVAWHAIAAVTRLLWWAAVAWPMRILTAAVLAPAARRWARWQWPHAALDLAQPSSLLVSSSSTSILSPPLHPLPLTLLLARRGGIHIGTALHAVAPTRAAFERLIAANRSKDDKLPVGMRRYLLSGLAAGHAAACNADADTNASKAADGNVPIHVVLHANATPRDECQVCPCADAHLCPTFRIFPFV
jgi:hypothetical protein